MKFVHCFLRAPIPMTLLINGVQMTVTNIAELGLQFVPQFVITESIDPPFTAAKGAVQGTNHHTYMGHQSEEQFLAVCGVQRPVTVAVQDQPLTYAPTIASDLAFLVALEDAMGQYGATMPIELSTLLGSFITTEKTRHGFSQS